MSASFSVRGKPATEHDLAEALALARQHKVKVAQAQRESDDRDADARRVGAAIRRGLAMDIEVKPASVSGSRRGGVRLRGFDNQLGLLLPMRASKVGTSGKSSFHLKLTPRGLGGHRRAKDRRYMRGEAVRAVRYVLREAAREIEGGGIVSNILLDPDDIAGFFSALEELEIAGGRDNANVYTSIVVSLPHELTGPERERLLADICRPLAVLNLPYAAVLHAPDPEGDQRNNYAHILASWRPFEHRADGKFALATTTLGAMNTTEFVMSLRRNAATAMNSAMAAAGQARRFTAEKQPGSAPAKEGTQKLGPGVKHSQRRAAGVEAAKAEKSWLEERASALVEIMRMAETWLFRDVTSRGAMIQAAQDREDIILKAHRAAIDAMPDWGFPRENGPSISTEPTLAAPPVSHEKPFSGVAPGTSTTEPAPAAQPVPQPGERSPIPAEPRQAEPVEQRNDPAPRTRPLRQDPSIATTIDQGDKHARSRHHHLAALAAARRAVAIPEPDHLAAGSLAAAQSLAGLRGLSGLGLVRDLDRPEVLLHGVSQAVVGVGRDSGAAEAERDAGDGVRRAGAGNRRVPAQDVSTDGSELTTGRPAAAASAPGLNESPPMPAGAPAEPEGVVKPASRSADRDAAARQQRKTPLARDAARAREASAALEAMSAMQFLPLRPVVSSGEDGRERQFTLVVDKAAPDDAALIRQASKFEADEQMQRLFAVRWEGLLAQMRADLTVSRVERPPVGRLGWLGADDEQYRASLSAAVTTDAFEEVLSDARSYWDARAQPQMPVANAGIEPAGAITEANIEEEDIDIAIQAAFGATRGGRAK